VAWDLGRLHATLQEAVVAVSGWKSENKAEQRLGSVQGAWLWARLWKEVSELLRGTLLIVIRKASCNTSHHTMLIISEGLEFSRGTYLLNQESRVSEVLAMGWESQTLKLMVPCIDPPLQRVSIKRCQLALSSRTMGPRSRAVSELSNLPLVQSLETRLGGASFTHSRPGSALKISR